MCVWMISLKRVTDGHIKGHLNGMLNQCSCPPHQQMHLCKEKGGIQQKQLQWGITPTYRGKHNIYRQTETETDPNLPIIDSPPPRSGYFLLLHTAK